MLSGSTLIGFAGLCFAVSTNAAVVAPKEVLPPPSLAELLLRFQGGQQPRTCDTQRLTTAWQTFYTAIGISQPVLQVTIFQAEAAVLRIAKADKKAGFESICKAANTFVESVGGVAAFEECATVDTLTQLGFTEPSLFVNDLRSMVAGCKMQYKAFDDNFDCILRVALLPETAQHQNVCSTAFAAGVTPHPEKFCAFFTTLVECLSESYGKGCNAVSGKGFCAIVQYASTPLFPKCKFNFKCNSGSGSGTGNGNAGLLASFGALLAALLLRIGLS